MSSFNWESFLKKWTETVLKSLERITWEYRELEIEAIKTGWLGYNPAAKEEIEALEEKLKKSLPPSYKEFLKVTNGWKQIGFDADNTRIYPVSEVDWLKVKYPNVINEWFAGVGEGREVPDDVYMVYGEEQDPVNMRDKYLKTALAVSELVDAGMYLLNPEVVTPDGEWEAWFFGYSLPGANRYRSFQEMMEAEYIRIRNNLKSAIEYEGFI